MEKFIQGCSLDCYDLCKMEVFKENGKVVKITGSKENNFTNGFICIKGIKHMERLYSPNRIKTPLLKKNGVFQEISFQEALEIIKEKLLHYREKFGSTSVIHYSESGSGGFLKGIEDIFFNFYGGITTSLGSTCWGAGFQAQDYDFGNKLSNSIDDLKNSKTIIFWGRNPFNTSIHLYQRALDAKKNGAHIITIDPRENETSKIADFHIGVNPSGDGALAMALTKIVLEKGWENREFIRDNVKGYEEYCEYLKELNIDYLLGEAGTDYETAEKLADLLRNGGVSTFIGYGMQKYYNGGNSIRAIDALLSITGNVGEKGAGAFYANRVYSNLLNSDPYESIKHAVNGRNFWVADFVNFIRKVNSPDSGEVPVKAVFISKCNPLNQYPNLHESIESFRDIEFKVCIDQFMTDTAKECDLFIPCSNTLETEDIIYSSMHCPNLIYNEKVVEPENILMDEFYFFRELGKIMGIKEYPQVDKKEYLNRVLAPLNLDIDKLKNSDYVHPVPEIAWGDKKFSTPSGKIEIYSESALRDGQSPIPVYISQGERDNVEAEKYPYRFITPHYKNSLFSQHFIDVEGRSKLYVSHKIMKKHDFQEGECVKLSSDKGEIICEIYTESSLKENLVYMFVGWNHKHGNPNFLTQNGSSEMGGQITYNETFVKIERI